MTPCNFLEVTKLYREEQICDYQGLVAEMELRGGREVYGCKRAGGRILLVMEPIFIFTIRMSIS